MDSRRDSPLPDLVLPAALTDPALAAHRNRRWKRLVARSAIAMGLWNPLTEIFQPSAKPVVFEQKFSHPGEPLDLRPDSDPRGRFAGRLTLWFYRHRRQQSGSGSAKTR